jgi:hypothetical protein
MTASVQALTWTSICETLPHVGRNDVTMLYDFSCSRRVYDQLVEFARYQENWDGLRSVSPTPQAIKAAVEYLKIARAAEIAPPASATLAPDGCVRIEWWFGDNVVQAEFGWKREIEWVEFGENAKPKHWSQLFDLNSDTRGSTWGANAVPLESGLSIQFEQLPNFTSALAGWFWKSYLIDILGLWLKTADAPHIADQFERFGQDALQTSIQLGIGRQRLKTARGR